MNNIKQKFDEFNMTWGFFMFIIAFGIGVALIILTEYWILGTALCLIGLLSIFRQMALLVA